MPDIPRPDKSVQPIPNKIPEQAKIDAYARSSNLFSAESSRDPVARLAELLTTEGLSPEQKTLLVGEHRARFKNRRKMAYISLYCLLALFIVVLIGIVTDGLYKCEVDDENCRRGILAVMNENSTVIVWISGFFTSIVAAYYGSTIIRPSS